MHTIWKGTISFGLVSIPVKLHAATEDKSIKLRTLHQACNSPIKYEKVCPNCNQEIDNKDLVKGYEYVKGKFVVLDEQELEEIKDEQQEKVVEVLDFVKLEEIDPVYFDKTYYMSANEGGAKPYSLLREAIKENGKIGIAKVMIRSKENLAVLRVYKDVLVMETLHYPDEVRGVDDVNAPSTKVTAKEMKAATMLIDQLTTTFEPTNYVDHYRLSLEELIQSKIEKNKDVTVKAEKGKDITDLMAALQASIDSAKESKKKESTKRKRARKVTS